MEILQLTSNKVNPLEKIMLQTINLELSVQIKNWKLERHQESNVQGLTPKYDYQRPTAPTYRAINNSLYETHYRI